jgi:signal transduction histidine kinase
MILPELVERKVTLVEDYGSANPCIRADRSKLEQVIINLVINGAQAMRDGGVIEVRTLQDSMFAIPRDEGLREMDLMKTGDDMVVIEIRDHGSGIQPHLLDRIFEPFFTTKPTGEGTGLGLPVAKRIVELHRGYLQVANADPPPGVRVRILLKSDLCPPNTTADEPDGSAGTNQTATTANP